MAGDQRNRHGNLRGRRTLPLKHCPKLVNNIPPNPSSPLALGSLFVDRKREEAEGRAASKALSHDICQEQRRWALGKKQGC